MRICIVSHEYPPHPDSSIAHGVAATARALADRGHEIHVVTNRAVHGSDGIQDDVEIWRDGNLTVHRLHLFEADEKPASPLRFCELNTSQYPDAGALWASDVSNLVAFAVAGFVRSLHAVTAFDVMLVPDRFAIGFYIVRQRLAGRRDAYPPVCVVAYGSTRHTLQRAGLVSALGNEQLRARMLREEHCVRSANGLTSSSEALIARYRDEADSQLPKLCQAVQAPATRLDSGASPGAQPVGLPAGRGVWIAGWGADSAADIATVRAFAELGGEVADLFLMLPANARGDAGGVAEAIAALTTGQRERLCRLPALPRGQRLAAIRTGVVVLHASSAEVPAQDLFDAMAVGSICVVSDACDIVASAADACASFAHNDAAALAMTLRRLLHSESERRGLAAAALRYAAFRAQDSRVAERLALFDQLAAAELAARAQKVPAVPARGLIVVDVANVAAAHVSSTLESVAGEARAFAGWRVVLFVGEGVGSGTDALPSHLARFGSKDPPPWGDLAADEPVLWLRGGVRFDRGQLVNVVALAAASTNEAGAFAWLRPPDIAVFPYAADGDFHAFAAIGSLIPAVLCVAAGRLAALASMAALTTPVARCASLIGAATLASGGTLLHTGSVDGDYYGESPILGVVDREQMFGHLDLCGLLPASFTTGHSRTKIVERAAPPPPAAPPVDQAQLAEIAHLRQVYAEHMRLKNSRAARFLRKLRLFDLARSIVPGSKRMLGSGRKS